VEFSALLYIQRKSLCPGAHREILCPACAGAAAGAAGGGAGGGAAVAGDAAAGAGAHGADAVAADGADVADVAAAVDMGMQTLSMRTLHLPNPASLPQPANSQRASS